MAGNERICRHGDCGDDCCRNDDLTRPGIDSIVEFSLLPHYYEEDIASKNGGLDISSRENVIMADSRIVRHYRSMMEAYVRAEDKVPAGTARDILDENQWMQEPAAARLKNHKELERLALKAYHAMYANYVVCSADRTNKTFPLKCCGESTVNVLMMLWREGIPHAAYASNNQWDHGYVIIPFRTMRPRKEGTIMADPTSDQLWEDGGPRNAVSVFLKHRMTVRWQYMTDWKKHKDYEGRKNLFPDEVISMLSMHAYFREHDVKEHLDFSELRTIKAEEYLKRSYDNPVRPAFLEK
ncbi:MAG: hypothetical protein R6U32_07270 [Candidatus Woesearchaeota archaeon]